MSQRVRVIALFCAFGATLLGGGHVLTEARAAGERPTTMLTAGEVKWADASALLRPGVEMAVLEGDPKQPGPFTMRLKFPAGLRMPAHRHPTDERVTVLSGTLHLAVGEKEDGAKTKALPAGSFVLVPAGVAHFGRFSEETVLQLNGMGPWGVTYLNPADGPRGR